MKLRSRLKQIFAVAILIVPALALAQPSAPAPSGPATQEQIASLQAAVTALHAQGALNGGLANALSTKLKQAQTKSAQASPAVAYHMIVAFGNQVRSLIAAGVLTEAESKSLLSATDLLLQSLQVGGRF